MCGWTYAILNCPPWMVDLIQSTLDLTVVHYDIFLAVSKWTKMRCDWIRCISNCVTRSAKMTGTMCFQALLSPFETQLYAFRMETKVFRTRLNGIRGQINVDSLLQNGFGRELAAIWGESTRFRARRIPDNSVMARLRHRWNPDNPVSAEPFRFSTYMPIHIFFATAYLLIKVLSP